MTPAIVIVGAGPRGTGILERLAANLPELHGDGPLDIHLVDPYPVGGGRIWRREQSPLLWMNSQAADVTMFTDDTVTMEGPVRPGPTLAQWSGLDGRTFPTRPQQGAYLRWFYEQAVASLPPAVTVHEHRAHALRVDGPRDGRQRVWLEGRAEPLTADAVIMTIGHLEAETDDEQRRLAAFAHRHGLVHLPPDFTADSDLSVLPAGEPVIVRGFGLAFIDLMVLLTEGRGGRYEGDEYHPSGLEPILYVGSRRGVPYRSKIGYDRQGDRPPLPRFFGPAQIDPVLERPGPAPVDFEGELWPLIDKELRFAHCHRLFTAHPERTRGTWAEFEERYAAAEPTAEALDLVIADAVPDPADRLDLAALDLPLLGERHTSYEHLQDRLREHITADLDRRHDPARSEDLAVFDGLLSVYGQLLRLGSVESRWHGFFSYLASGPPGPRLRQMLALSRAGIVRFLGPGITVDTDERQGVFRASGGSLPGRWTEARALVEARLPEPPTPALTRSPLLRALYEDGADTSESGLLPIDPADGRVLERDGRGPHPRRFALGPYTTSRAAPAFTRPGTGGPGFRQNDAVARAVLALLPHTTERPYAEGVAR
ncbi:FAD/NAD(P)-binding protein [Streptomyces sp. SP18CS02]|uniref:FAD/NAD(P)-binding protein n=1 Tax=Streptomyces sp. SP18CS02 TaxID=3002531 RepID=UPI002E77E51D|nr:FAD/NAD(P)-binding protein [Streptomyces sp. SP18CS02]MEE1752435.1 FAD/NAD(P)-binding protein [Streptomyces sp. SP18CS02]